jgi:hypothetical protein
MMKLRGFTLIISAMAIATFLTVGALAVVPTGDSSKKADKPRLLAPINLAILIQDDLVSRVSNEIETTRNFIRSLPSGSRVMVGYVTTGSLQVRQPFTTDLEKAAGSLRIPIASTSASAFNPYVEVIEALRKFDSEAKNQDAKNQNVLLLISDGLDDSRGFDASVLQSVDLERAIAEAKRRDVPIYSFYAPSVGLTGRSRLAASYGQSSLNRVSNETGGKAFFQGFSFVSFNSHFERLIDALNNYERP